MNAEIFVRYMGEPPTQEQIDKWNKDFNYKMITRSFDESYECTISVAKDMGYRYYYTELLKETEGFVMRRTANRSTIYLIIIVTLFTNFNHVSDVYEVIIQ